MRERKYKTYRKSKYQYPTRVVKNGSEGVLKIGRLAAKAALRDALGRSVDHMIEDDTSFEWLFKEPLENESSRV